MSSENPYDQACRYLLRDAGLEMLTWLVDLPAEALGFVRWLDTRLSVPGLPERTSDTIAHVQRLDQHGVPWAIQVEFQSDVDPDMTGRLLVYAGLLWQHKPNELRGDRFEILQVVVNLTGTGRAARRMVWRDRAEILLEPIEWNMETLDAAAVLAQIAEGKVTRMLLPWIPLMQHGGEEDIINQWLERANQETNTRRRSTFDSARTFAELADRGEVWKKALEGFDMRESAVANEWKAEGRAETLRIVLEERFGVLPKDLLSALTARHDIKALDQWAKIAARASSLDHFRQEAGI